MVFAGMNAGAASPSRWISPEFDYIYPVLEDGPYEVYGTVTGVDGTPAVGVSVVAFRGEAWDWGYADTVTDEHGKYAFKSLPEGAYNHWAIADHAFSLQVFTLHSFRNMGGPLQRDMRLKPFEGTPTRGRVVDEAGSPVENALILFGDNWSSYGMGLAMQVRTDSNGLFSFNPGFDYPDMRFNLEVFAEGYGVGVRKGVQPGSANNDIVLGKGLKVSGKLRFRDAAKAVGGIQVSLQRRRLPTITTNTNEMGLFSFRQLAPDYYTLNVLDHEKECTVVERLALNMADGESRQDLDVLLSQGASLSGRVTVRETGEPIEDVALRITNSGRPRIRQTVTTGADGMYQLPHLHAGKVWVECVMPEDVAQERYSDSGYDKNPTRIEVEVGPEEVVTGIDFDFARGVTVSGLVTDEEGNPLSGVGLKAWGNKLKGTSAPTAFTPETQTGKDGQYNLSGFIAGEGNTYGLRVSARGYVFHESERFEVTEAIAGKDVVLKRAARISGRLRTLRGSPIPFDIINIKPMDMKPGPILPQGVFTDERGSFAFNEGLSQGRYFFEVHTMNTGFGPYRQILVKSVPIVIESVEENRYFEVVMPGEDEYGSITCTVLDAATNQSIENARIEVLSSITVGGQEYGTHGWARAGTVSGTYRVESVCPGTVSLQVSAEGYSKQEFNRIAVDPGEETSGVRIVLRSAG
jgi:protocatechuate 3,4-dioxygenase beta subunit